MQTSYLHSVFSTFVIRLLESITSRLATSKHLIFELVSVAEQAGLNLNLSETMKTGFLALRLIAVNSGVNFSLFFTPWDRGNVDLLRFSYKLIIKLWSCIKKIPVETEK